VVEGLGAFDTMLVFSMYSSMYVHAILALSDPIPIVLLKLSNKLASQATPVAVIYLIVVAIAAIGHSGVVVAAWQAESFTGKHEYVTNAPLIVVRTIALHSIQVVFGIAAVTHCAMIARQSDRNADDA